LRESSLTGIPVIDETIRGGRGGIEGEVADRPEALSRRMTLAGTEKNHLRSMIFLICSSKVLSISPLFLLRR
jgi:hypothetical protein